MSNVLNVYWNKDIVGTLHLDESRRFVFQYAPEWLMRENPMPLSLGLPLQAEAYSDDRARPFFANLLPESELRRIIARKLGLSEQNDFALLEAVGGECAGAISLSEAPLPDNNSRYRVLDDEQLNILIAELHKRPMLAGEQGIRLSLAGAQNKLPVYFDGSQISLPMGTAASSHILKPPIKLYTQTVENEAFCMMLAARLNLPVPEVTILQKAEPLYLITRYDRQPSNQHSNQQDQQSNITRLHQEDFCQALGITPDMKYEKEGGPGLKACFELLRNNSIQPVADVQHLLHWVVFNYLIGNADAHAKNIALLFTSSGPVLAPFYDLICTAMYDELSERLAMKIGGEDRPDWIIARCWQQFSQDINVGYKLIKQILENMSKQIVTEAKTAQHEFTTLYGECALLENIISIIETRSAKVINSLAAAD